MDIQFRDGAYQMTLTEAVKQNATPQRVFSGLLKALAVMGLMGVGMTIYALYWEGSYLYYQNLPFDVQVPVEAGRPVTMVIERCNKSKTEQVYVTTRGLKRMDDGFELILPAMTMTIAPGCHRSINKTIIVPRDIKPGTYHLFGMSVAKGMVVDHQIPWYSEPFDVVPMSDRTAKINSENAADSYILTIPPGTHVEKAANARSLFEKNMREHMDDMMKKGK
ncbi:MAG: hypothetical protein JWR85_4195 [Marmoricola sp.]|nr:hypothetical protein [Marmoricola sp.]